MSTRRCINMVHIECIARGGTWPDDAKYFTTNKGVVRSKCRKCNMKIARDYRRSRSPEKILAANTRSYHKNVAKRRDAKKVYYRENRPAFRIRERLRSYKIKDETKPGDWFAVLRLFGRRCLRCGTRKDITMDHVIPLSKGGRHHISNFQPLCRSCNSSKGVKTIDYRKPDARRK